MRRKFTLGQRVALGASTLVLFVLAASALGFWHVRASARTLDASQDSVRQISRLADLESSWSKISSTLDRMLLTRQTNMIDEDLARERAVFDEALSTLADQPFGNEANTIAENADLVADLQFLGSELDDLVDQIQVEARQRHWPQAQVLRHAELAALQRRFEGRLEQLRSNTSEEINSLVALSARRQRATSVFLTIGLAVAAILGAVFTLVAVRAITDPINQLIDRTRRVTEGDFTYVTPLQRDDEIGVLSTSFSIMTEWLADSYRVLEERVEERTGDLALAAEVGRRLGRVRDLDSLLQEAVELIGNRFNLYHTQVYLISTDGRNLELRAGTGSVGEELRRRGFKLPVDRSSVNGFAARERRPMIIPDTEQSGYFRANALLPDTLSEIAMPLLVDEHIVGVLDLQSNRRYGLTEENLAAFEVLAGQLAIAIENALLFSESRAARAELEGQAQGRIKESWQAFLNAVERPERLVYSFARGALIAESRIEATDAVGDNSLNAAIALNDVSIGRIRVKAQPQQHWTPQDLEVVEEIARLVAQQVENLRLLAEAQHYREEAERALQRLMFQSWKQLGETVGAYRYDGRQVVALEAGVADYDLSSRLTVRGEVVGELMLETIGKDNDEAAVLAAAVAARLSAHLEHLRLTRETEVALGDVQRRSEELADLNRMVTRIASTLDLRNSLQIVVEELVSLTVADQARIGLLDDTRQVLTIVSEQFDESRSPSALGLTIPIEGNALTQEVLSKARPVVIRDAQIHPLTAPIRGMLSEQGIQSMIVLPILSGNEVIGTVGADILGDGIDFDDEDIRRAETIVFQAATAIQNARLFDQIQTTLTETRALYRASAELNRARTYGDLLEVLRQHTVAGEKSTTLSLAIFDRPWTETTTPDWIDILAYWSAQPVREPKLRFSLEEYPALTILERDRQSLIPDVADDPRLDPRSRRVLLRAFKARTVLAVPLVAGGQWIGHVNALYPEPKQFSEGELQQLQNLVGQAAVAVQSINLLEETSRLLESEQRQRRISDALVRATSRMLGVVDEPQIRQVVLEEIENLLGPDQITLYIWRPEGDFLQVERRRLVRGVRHDDYLEGQTIAKERRADLWRVLQTDEPVVCQMPSSDDFIHEQYIVPWHVGHMPGGLIELYRTARGAAIREEDQASIEGIVQQAAIRLQSARLFEEAKLRTAETEALYRASRYINTAASYREVLDALRQHTVLGIDARSVGLYFFERPWTPADTPEWVEVLAHWSSVPHPMPGPRFALAEFRSAAEILRASEVTLIADVAKDPRLDESSRALIRNHPGAASALFVPLQVAGQWLGYIDAIYTATVVLPEEEMRRLLALASQAAAAVQGLHLLRQAEIRAQRERVLREITARVHSATDLEVIMKTAVREVSRALGRDAFLTLGEPPARTNGSSIEGSTMERST